MANFGLDGVLRRFLEGNKEPARRRVPLAGRCVGEQPLRNENSDIPHTFKSFTWNPMDLGFIAAGLKALNSLAGAQRFTRQQ